MLWWSVGRPPGERTEDERVERGEGEGDDAVSTRTTPCLEETLRVAVPAAPDPGAVGGCGVVVDWWRFAWWERSEPVG